MEREADRFFERGKVSAFKVSREFQRPGGSSRFSLRCVVALGMLGEVSALITTQEDRFKIFATGRKRKALTSKTETTAGYTDEKHRMQTFSGSSTLK